MTKKVEVVTARKVKVVRKTAHKHAKLTDVQENLSISEEKLSYAIENGYLKTAIKLPLCLVERSRFENYELLEGLVGVRPQDAYDILNDGYKELQKFISIDLGEPIRLVNEFQRYLPFFAGKKNLVVVESHLKEFEDIRRTLSTFLEFEASKDYSEIIMQGIMFDLAGDIQRIIIKQLYEAFLNGEPEVHKDDLLRNARSSSTDLRDLFDETVFKALIKKGKKKGHYCLNLRF